jgi:hypothetical protein
VRSVLGAGSTFTLTLPHIDVTEPALDASAGARSPAEGQIA